ncbi:MAG: hypothetical protein AAF497_17120, partial [Planctomycetota bacterium]
MTSNWDALIVAVPKNFMAIQAWQNRWPGASDRVKADCKPSTKFVGVATKEQAEASDYRLTHFASISPDSKTIKVPKNCGVGVPKAERFWLLLDEPSSHLVLEYPDDKSTRVAYTPKTDFGDNQIAGDLVGRLLEGRVDDGPKPLGEETCKVLFVEDSEIEPKLVNAYANPLMLMVSFDDGDLTKDEIVSFLLDTNSVAHATPFFSESQFLISFWNEVTRRFHRRV